MGASVLDTNRIGHKARPDITGQDLYLLFSDASTTDKVPNDFFYYKIHSSGIQFHCVSSPSDDFIIFQTNFFYFLSLVAEAIIRTMPR